MWGSAIDEYSAWSKTAEKPKNIPADPRTVYGEEFDSMGDWLGTGTIGEGYGLGHSLAVKSKWLSICYSK